MSNKLKELISKLEKAIIEARDNTEHQLALKQLLNNMKKNAVVDNWVSEEVIKTVSKSPDLMQNKYKSFKQFCKSLKPTKIELDEEIHELFFGEPKPVNKPKSRG